MKVLGKIKQVCDARTWMNGANPITIYPVIFEAGENVFVGDMFKSADGLKRRGIAAGAIGEMDIQFSVRDGKRSSGESYTVQQVRFKDFYLANAGVFNGHVDELSESPAQAAAPVETQQPAQAAQPAEVKKDDMPF